MASLAVRSLARRARPGAAALNGVSLEIEDGRIASLLGPASTGKTALLRAIAGLDPLDRGEVLIDGVAVMNRPAHQRRIGLVFQDLALFETQTARDNVAFGMRARGWAEERCLQQADELLLHIGLGEHATRQVAELSPEARGRVALARAIAPRPDLLLLDEPAATLGELQRSLWRELLGDLLHDFGITALVATQDVREASAFADVVAVFMQGRVLQLGPTARVLASPSSTIVAELVGYQRLIDGTWHDGELREADVGALAGPKMPPIEPTATAMAHPSAMFAIPAEQDLGAGLIGTVERAIPEGPVWNVRVRLDAEGRRTVVARWEWDLAPPAAGTRLAIVVVPGTLRFFTSSGTPSTAIRAPRAAAPRRHRPPRPIVPRRIESRRHTGAMADRRAASRTGIFPSSRSRSHRRPAPSPRSFSASHRRSTDLPPTLRPIAPALCTLTPWRWLTCSVAARTRKRGRSAHWRVQTARSPRTIARTRRCSSSATSRAR